VAAWPTLKEVRTLLRLQPDPTEDAVIDSARAAAVDYGIRRLSYKYPTDATDLPDTAHQAALLDAARLYRRRDSIDGTIGFGDMGAIRIGRTDADVERLYASSAPLVFG
jgi:hypothetical protein